MISHKKHSFLERWLDAGARSRDFVGFSARDTSILAFRSKFGRYVRR
jgi:hypothetical protein